MGEASDLDFALSVGVPYKQTQSPVPSTILEWTFPQNFLRQDVIENSCSPERNALHSCSTKFLRLALKPYSSTDSKPVICPLKAHTSTLI